MKYYKGTRKRKRSSKSKISSPESQNTSNTLEGSTVSKDETANLQSSSSKKKSAIVRKRPSSTPPSETDNQTTRKTKRVKSSRITPKKKNKNTKSKYEKPDLSTDESESKMFSDRKKRSQSTTTRSRSDESSRKRVKSSEVIRSNSSSVANKTGETPRDVVFGTVQKNSKSTKRKKSKQIKPNSSGSSDTAESIFEDSEEGMRQAVRSGGESDNNFDILSIDVNSDGAISCSEFLQQQVRILKSEFEIEDCPELDAHLQGTKRQQKNHIPKEIVLKVLRKLNFKVEDELLKSLNRQAQRKILQQVDEIRLSSGMNGKKRSNDENTGQQPEVDTMEELRKTVEMSTADLDGLKRLTNMAAEIESMAEGFSTNPLVDDVKHTNKLIQKLNKKVNKEGFTNAFQETLTTKGPLSHQEIVDKLFSMPS